MSSERLLIPQIRFKGFTEAWEQRKLGELGLAQSGIGFPNTEQGGTEGTPFFKVSDMNMPGNEHELVASNNYVTPEQIARMGWHPINQVPAIFFAKVGAAVMLNRKRLINKPFLLDNNTMAFSIDSSSLNTQFGQSLFERIDLTSLIQIGALPSYNSSDVERITVSLPSTMDEQCRIGQCLCNINDLITLHQRKLDALKKIKSALLEKMFPKNGSNVPEIRFTGFTEAWEQRKLSDIATKQTSKNTDSTILEPFTNSAEQGVVSQYDYFDHGITNVANISNYFVICPNDFVYNPRISVTAPCGPINRNRLNRPGIMSPLYTIFRTNQSIDVTYLEYYFKTKKWHPFMFLEGNTGARSDRFSISDSTFFKLPIQIPSKAEQKLISKQLEALSNLIALHQRKLDALKKIKSALLEKMFV